MYEASVPHSNQELGNFRNGLRGFDRAVDDLMRGNSWSGKGLEALQVRRFRPAAA
jgi:hypothetical protein